AFSLVLLINAVRIAKRPSARNSFERGRSADWIICPKTVSSCFFSLTRLTCARLWHRGARRSEKYPLKTEFNLCCLSYFLFNLDGQHFQNSVRWLLRVRYRSYSLRLPRIGQHDVRDNADQAAQRGDFP